ncbi:hypothetical protein Bbelb_042240 [Branchiostoma belcheri]|nr:hypothetical protein Bbelb_042240 [Branchiostoma belcheri]
MSARTTSEEFGTTVHMQSERQERGPETMEQAVRGLKSINECELPGRLKVWCVQFMLFPRLKWPLKTYNISLSVVDQIDRKANAYFRRWLGVPRCLSTVALFGDNMLSLPLSSIAEEHKVEKVRLVLELEGSQDSSVRAVSKSICTGRKWKVKEVISQAVNRLHHKDLVGAVQVGRTGLGWGVRSHRWSSANPRERRQLVTQEMRRMEEEKRRVAAVGQRQQGAWLNWEGANVTRWFKNEETCLLCGLERADLKHILSNCKTALQQGQYTWRHNRALRQIATTLENVRRESAGTETSWQPIQFVRGGQRPKLRKQPPEVTTLAVIHSAEGTDQKSVVIVELTTPWEENIHCAHERKKLKYEELAQQFRQNGWRTHLYPVEVGVRGFADFQIRGKAQYQFVRAVAEEVEKSSFSIWIRRKSRSLKQSRDDCVGGRAETSTLSSRRPEAYRLPGTCDPPHEIHVRTSSLIVRVRNNVLSNAQLPMAHLGIQQEIETISLSAHSKCQRGSGNGTPASTDETTFKVRCLETCW